MKVLRVTGTPDQPRVYLDQAPVPTPAEGELLIRVCAAGLMRSELLWDPTWHKPSGEPRAGAVPGHEFSGLVEGLGRGAGGFEIGQEVFGMNDWYSDGAMAELTTAPASSVALKPRRLTHVEAASAPIGALTAWQALFDHAHLQPDESVLIHGGAGSVGMFAVQFAHAHGASVTATVSAPSLDFVTSLGADAVVDYRKQRFDELGARFDVVLDTVGGETLARSWSVLVPGGRLVTIVSTDDQPMEPRVQKAFFIVEPSQQQLSAIGRKLDSGELRTAVDVVVPLSRAPEAYAGIGPRSGRGKLVVAVERD